MMPQARTGLVSCPPALGIAAAQSTPPRCRLLEQFHERAGARRDSPRFVVDDMKVSPEPNASEPEGAEPAGSDFSPHRVGRDKGNTKTSHDTLLDRLGMVELHRYSKPDACPQERAFGDTPSGGSLLTQEQGLVGEQLGRDLPALGPRVCGRDDQDKLIEHSCG